MEILTQYFYNSENGTCKDFIINLFRIILDGLILFFNFIK